MGKTLAQRKQSAPVAQDELDSKLAEINARSLFMTSSVNMGFRLLVTVVIPIVGGVKLDEHFHTSPNYTLLGVMIAAIAGCTAVWATVKEVNASQAGEDISTKKSRKNIKEKK